MKLESIDLCASLTQALSSRADVWAQRPSIRQSRLRRSVVDGAFRQFRRSPLPLALSTTGLGVSLQSPHLTLAGAAGIALRAIAGRQTVIPNDVHGLDRARALLTSYGVLGLPEYAFVQANAWAQSHGHGCLAKLTYGVAFGIRCALQVPRVLALALICLCQRVPAALVGAMLGCAAALLGRPAKAPVTLRVAPSLPPGDCGSPQADASSLARQPSHAVVANAPPSTGLELVPASQQPEPQSVSCCAEVPGAENGFRELLGAQVPRPSVTAATPAVWPQARSSTGEKSVTTQTQNSAPLTCAPDAGCPARVPDALFADEVRDGEKSTTRKAWRQRAVAMNAVPTAITGVRGPHDQDPRVAKVIVEVDAFLRKRRMLPTEQQVSAENLSVLADALGKSGGDLRAFSRSAVFLTNLIAQRRHSEKEALQWRARKSLLHHASLCEVQRECITAARKATLGVEGVAPLRRALDSLSEIVDFYRACLDNLARRLDDASIRRVPLWQVEEFSAHIQADSHYGRCLTTQACRLQLR